MPLQYSISQDGREILVTGEGLIEMQDCMDLFARIRNDHRKRKGSNVLVDLQHANCNALQEDSIVAATRIAEDDRHHPYGHIAVVARGATLLHAELLAAQLRGMSHISIQVFVDMDAAKAFCAGANGTGPAQELKPY